MKKSKEMNKKSTAGITLVALVVTIVVLIILATISISIIFDNDGIMTRAKQTQEYQANADAQWEKTNANVIAYVTEATGNKGKTIDKEETIQPDKVEAGATTHEPTALTYSWEEINKIARAISNTNIQENVVEDGEITNDTVEVNLEINGKPYTVGVGDKKTLTIGSTNYVARIMGFNHDKLTSTSAYEQKGKTNVYAGISFEFVDILTTAAMSGTSTSNSTNVGGWAASAIYDVVAGYKDEIDIAMTGTNTNSYLKQVQKKYLATYNSATQSTSNDYLWLLACSEIWSKGVRYINASWVQTEGAYGRAYATEGEQYKYYKMKEIGGNSSHSTDNNYFKKPNSVIGTSSSGQIWWLRSPSDASDVTYCHMSDTGQCNTSKSYSYYTYGVAPGFSI